WGKVEKISPDAYGNPERLPAGQRGHVSPSDHLPAGVEEIGTLPGASGPEPVRLARRHFADGVRWVFTRSTVDHIDGWWSRLDDRWQMDYMPERLLRVGPRDLLWWQWIAIPLSLGASLGVGRLLAWLTRRVLGRFVASTKTTLDDAILAHMS